MLKKRGFNDASIEGRAVFLLAALPGSVFSDLASEPVSSSSNARVEILISMIRYVQTVRTEATKTYLSESSNTLSPVESCST